MSRDAALGERLASQGRWLQLLLLHLTGPKLRERVELEDLVQEVFLRALGAQGGIPAAEPGEAALRRYLARVARGCVMDVLRALRAAKRSGNEFRLERSDWSTATAGGVSADTAGPATRASESDEHAALMRAYDRLSPEHRRVLGLRQLEGLPAAEVARRLGRSETAIHSLYRRALEAWAEAAKRRPPPGSA